MLVKMLDPNIAVNTELTTRKLRDETLEPSTVLNWGVWDGLVFVVVISFY